MQGFPFLYRSIFIDFIFLETPIYGVLLTMCTNELIFCDCTKPRRFMDNHGDVYFDLVNYEFCYEHLSVCLLDYGTKMQNLLCTIS